MVPERIRAVVAAPNRSDADRALDPGRHPAEMLAFFEVSPGMQVAEFGAGGGYTTELLARAFGPAGAVFIVLFYHDTVWMKVDRLKMNHAVFEALRPGGIYAVVDHSARPGAGLDDAQTLHRIEETTLKKEIEQAGFELVGEADFLRNSADTRDWNDSPAAADERRGTSDRFVRRFVKPHGAGPEPPPH